MSIFKGTLNPEIAAQLKAREKIISQVNDNNQVGLKPRDETFLQYATSNNSWVRMVSFVNANVGCTKEKDKNTGKPILDSKGNPKEKCLYEGDDLAKKYVLEGGTQYYNKDNNTFTLREGVGKANSIYASDIDSGALKSDFRQFGYRPMPGITSVDVVNKGAYGSLRQATIKFYCWDKHQLDELEILFMRVGYSVLLEWGWSQYLNHDKSGKNGINTYPDNIKLTNFNDAPINPFSPLEEDDIYNKIDNGISKHNGNYDAMLGYIQNFSWQMMSNGGFECTTVLISRGEVISSLKASSNPYTIIDDIAQTETYLENTINSDGEAEKPTLSLFEKIFLNIKAHDNQSEIYDEKGEFYVNFESGVSENDAIRKDNQDKIKEQVKNTFENIQRQVGEVTLKGVSENGNIIKVKYPNFHANAWLKPADALNDGTAIEYIPLDQVITLLNTHFLWKTTKNEPIVNIVLPQNTPCLACEDSVSIDPTTCLIRNDFATFIVGNTEGFNPTFYKLDSSKQSAQWKNKTNINLINSFTEKKSDVVIGKIGNIYVSIQKIIDIYRSKAGSSDGVSVLEFLEDLLDNISRSLGGVNDFKLYTQRNIVQIIDAKYLELSTDPNGASEKKFTFDLVGLKSICRDVKINSRIFSEQASMIAIAAAASGQGQNVGDIYSSTQQEFNKGLTDRIIRDISFADLKDESTESNYYYNLWNNIRSLTGYIKRKVLGIPATISTGGKTSWDVIRIPAENEITNASTLLNTFIMQLNGKDIDFKAIIPFELEITLDGIGGFIIGQIFTVDKSILPSQYAKSNIGFIITGVNQSLHNNDWTTVLRTQICLLDNDKTTKKLSKDMKNNLKKIIAQIDTQQQINGYISNAMADYLVYLTVNILANKNKGVGLVNVPIEYDEYLTEVKPDDTTKTNPDLGHTVNIIKKSLQFYNSAAPTGGYLYQWWKKSKDQNLKDFPQDFNDLINVKTFDGKTIKLNLLLNTFNEVEVINRGIKESESGVITGQGTGLKPSDIFIYRYFNNNPLSELKTQFSETVNINTLERIGNTIYLNLNSLRVKYLSEVGNFLTNYKSQGEENKYIRPGVSPDSTIESSLDITKSKLIWFSNVKLKDIR